ncbi:hypothetical protein CORC01_00331 [Colletotrichum orchidophilum]|uniref:Uncharacterized protein n=1 Tax=Colletotrichum orchidophilum TaxID=1209926 RepID=A0A1G4BST4_9PEZI|nr:uncharacterized protein CORC01_00331 [Colletotrichum orchidophilum]OHF04479.1 hypothetical protein CORC01_00331 [Colletotrichum orchidophilum]
MPASKVSVVVNGASASKATSNPESQAAESQSRVTEFLKTDCNLYRRLSQNAPNRTVEYETRARDAMREVDTRLQRGAN